MVQFLENNQWVELPSLEAVYNLFAAQPGILRQPRTAPITLVDGTVITPDAAIQGLLTIGVQKFMDKAAQTAGYDDIHAAALRAGYAGPYQAEGTKFAIWMDQVWLHCYQVLDAVKAGTQAQPTLAELIAGLPTLPTA